MVGAVSGSSRFVMNISSVDLNGDSRCDWLKTVLISEKEKVGWCWERMRGLQRSRARASGWYMHLF